MITIQTANNHANNSQHQKVEKILFSAKNQLFISRNRQLIIIFAKYITSISMIQRIQTLFLLAVVILNPLLYFLPIANIGDNQDTAIFVTGLSHSSQWYLHLIFVPCYLLPLWQIFIYKNRPKQIKVGVISILYTFFWSISFVMLTLKHLISNLTITDLAPTIGILIPILSVILITLANRSIKRDEELVRSIDRIR